VCVYEREGVSGERGRKKEIVRERKRASAHLSLSQRLLVHAAQCGGEIAQLVLLLMNQVVVRLNHEVLAIQFTLHILFQLLAALELVVLLYNRLVLRDNLLYSGRVRLG
jgi:hypothetical protein